jgi:REP element-mobilizing transposase RayT
MGRRRREEYEGGIYHVISRGDNKEIIFRESIDKGYFIKQIKETINGMGYKVFGYVLMSNHYHLIVQILDQKLQKIMHQINSKYSKYFNKKYERVGHVFQGRYTAIPVQDERYLIDLLRYVHQNPVKAQMCRKTDEYEWSSDAFYRRNLNGFVSIDDVLDMLDKNRKAAIEKYTELMIQETDKDYSNVGVIGDEAYQMMCMNRKKNEARMSLDEILIGTGVNMADYYLIKSGSRKRSLLKYKLAYIWAAKELNYTNKEIGENINMTASAINYLIARYGRVKLSEAEGSCGADACEITV